MATKRATTATYTLQRRPVDRILYPFQEFAKVEAAGGILLLMATVLAVVWANSPWGDAYVNLSQTRLTVGLGAFSLSKPLLLWINDGLMAIFFFVVGLEIKREILVGELASVRQAALPIAAAIGGSVVPALLYVALNWGGPGIAGWAIPMATDIAFALGVLTLLGSRAPLALKIFLTALAIVDDILAVLVIALFYTAQIVWSSLGIAGVFLVGLILMNRLGVRRPLIYGLLGVGMWVAFLLSGVHATIAGVLLALTIPASTRINANQFLIQGRALLDEFERTGTSGTNVLVTSEQSAVLHGLEKACEDAETPLQRLEHGLHPWVSFAIMPIFALANAGVALGGEILGALSNSVSLGIIAGLVIGKQGGITLATWLVVRSGIATLPAGVSWRHIWGAGWLAGIGFTMSLFIAGLAFGDSPLLDSGKVGILAASLISGIVGSALLLGTRPVSETPPQ